MIWCAWCERARHRVGGGLLSCGHVETHHATQAAGVMASAVRGRGIVKPSTIAAWRAAAWVVMASLALLMLLLPTLAHGQVPADASRYKRDLTRQARLVWGMDAPIATMAGQVEQESGWRPDARSAVGAIGLAQFMPSTAKWISGLDAELSSNDPTNPSWAMRALALYNRQLWDGTSATTPCHHAAKMLSAYNGGVAWIARDEDLAKRAGLNPDLWWDNVERVNSGRTLANWNENRKYPAAILFLREPRYVDAGWGAGLCYDEAK